MHDFPARQTIKPGEIAISLAILVTSWFGREMEPAAVFCNNALSRLQEYIKSKTVNTKVDTAITKSKEDS
jgi:hypothetical protein